MLIRAPLSGEVTLKVSNEDQPCPSRRWPITCFTGVINSARLHLFRFSLAHPRLILSRHLHSCDPKLTRLYLSLYDPVISSSICEP